MGTNGKKSVRILLLGDPGVGKTSLIFSLVSEEFHEDGIPPRAEEITIPPDVTPERVATQIVDYSAQEQSQEAVKLELNKANVICIVYAVDDDDTIDKITSFWLPFIRDHLGEDHNTPVVLVGNKTDLVEYSSLEVVLPIMNQYSEVETCVECSAKSLKNISELFYYAQKAVLHPTAPLYSPEERDLTEKCQRALTRIFKLCDVDNDGILNDHELNKFQRRCFNTPLQPQALDDVKNIVKRNIPDGVFEDGLTLPGFLFLQTLFIQRGRHETTWTILRKFGYNDKVEMDLTHLRPHLDVPIGSSTELTLQGYQFLNQTFDRFDKDHDSALSPAELQSLCSVFENAPAWLKSDYVGELAVTNEKGWLTKQGYLSLWTLIASVDVKLALECLSYLGYNSIQEENQLSAIQVTRDKRLDLQRRQTNRNVFLCHVIGPQGAGKSSFLKGFLGKTNLTNSLKSSKDNVLGSLSNYVINKLKIYDQHRYLIMREIDISLDDNLGELELFCDVVCLMYDSSDPKSFEFVARIFLKHFISCKLPVLFVAAKSDEPQVRQQYSLQPEEFSIQHKLPPPHPFCIHKDIIDATSNEVYVKLGTMAAYPNLRRLVHVLLMRPTPSWVTQNFSALQNSLPQDALTWVRAGVGVATLAIVGMFIMRLVRSNDGPR